MRASVTYQAILEEGRLEGRLEARESWREEGALISVRRFVLLLGARKYGEPSAADRDALDAIRSVEVLEEIMMRIEGTPDWKSLLAEAQIKDASAVPPKTRL